MKLTDEERMNICQKAAQMAEQLLENGCDSVMIAATMPDGNQTSYSWSIKGNSFAARDNVRTWLRSSERDRDDCVDGCSENYD